MAGYVVERCCNEFKQRMYYNMHEKRFIWRNIDNERMTGVTPKLLPYVLERLKGIFIDCQIIVDPLNTYLIIDWS